MINKTKNIIKVAGYDLAYHSEGSGTPVLLVHGITTYSFIWRNIVPLLKDNYQVISIDLLGCGDSAKPLDISYSLCHHASLLREFMQALGYEKFHFVGHDIGGGIGQIFAVNYPDILIDLTLVNSVGHDFWPVQPIITMRTPIIRQLAMATLDLGAFRLIVRRGLYHKNRLTTELMEQFRKPMKSKNGRKAFLRFANSLNNHQLVDIEDNLRQLNLPVLIIRGDADIYLSGAIAEKLERDIPGSHLVRLATAGHYIQEDEPQLVTGEMLKFFQATRADTTGRESQCKI